MLDAPSRRSQTHGGPARPRRGISGPLERAEIPRRPGLANRRPALAIIATEGDGTRPDRSPGPYYKISHQRISPARHGLSPRGGPRGHPRRGPSQDHQFERLAPPLAQIEPPDGPL